MLAIATGPHPDWPAEGQDAISGVDSPSPNAEKSDETDPAAEPMSERGAGVGPGETLRLRLVVNRRPVELLVAPHRTLLEVLREDLGLTGTKHGCELGECGACTVLVEGRPELACLRLAAACDGAEVTTIEGLARGPELDPLQETFADTGAVQCGYCTPGMLLVAHELLERNPRPSRDEIRLAISGNLCRCTGYLRIIEAIEQAAELRRSERA